MKSEQKYNIFIDVAHLKCPRPTYIVNKILQINKYKHSTLLFKIPGTLHNLDIRLLFKKMAYNIIVECKKTSYTRYTVKKNYTERET